MNPRCLKSNSRTSSIVAGSEPERSELTDNAVGA